MGELIAKKFLPGLLRKKELQNTGHAEQKVLSENKKRRETALKQALLVLPDLYPYRLPAKPENRGFVKARAYSIAGAKTHFSSFYIARQRY